MLQSMAFIISKTCVAGLPKQSHDLVLPFDVKCILNSNAHIFLILVWHFKDSTGRVQQYTLLQRDRETYAAQTGNPAHLFDLFFSDLI